MKLKILILLLLLTWADCYCQNTQLEVFYRDSTTIKTIKSKHFEENDKILILYRLGNGIKEVLLISYNDTTFKNIIILDKNGKNIYSQKWEDKLVNKPTTFINKIFDCICDSVLCCDIPIFLLINLNSNMTVIQSSIFLNSNDKTGCNEHVMSLKNIFWKSKKNLPVYKKKG